VALALAVRFSAVTLAPGDFAVLLTARFAAVRFPAPGAELFFTGALAVVFLAVATGLLSLKGMVGVRFRVYPEPLTGNLGTGRRCLPVAYL
jgi:hypothetical protein